jgi:DNA (cytosine-5)-methyltransferase 1
VPGQLDLLAGGPPCQSFSLIGKRGSLEDDRGLLLFEMVRFAEAFMPKAILIEQVRGLVSAPGADNKRGGALKSLLSRLEALGYQVSHKILRAADYGVPQLRDRLFIIGTRDRQFEFPEPTHFRLETVTKLKSNLFDRKLKPYMTVEDAIGDLPSPTGKEEPETFPNHVDVTPSRDIERITGVPEGDYLARQMHLPADQRQRLNPKKDTTKFRRLAWSEPSLTLRGGEAFYHPTGNRYLTPREFMRIHGFGDAHILSGPIRGRSGSFRTLDQHRQVANAVPPPLAKALGEALIRQILIHDEQELMAAV